MLQSSSLFNIQKAIALKDGSSSNITFGNYNLFVHLKKDAFFTSIIFESPYKFVNLLPVDMLIATQEDQYS